MIAVTFSGEHVVGVLQQCADFVRLGKPDFTEPEFKAVVEKLAKDAPVLAAPAIVHTKNNKPANAAPATPTCTPGPAVTAKALAGEQELRGTIALLIPRAVKSIGRDAVVALLGEFGVQKGGELKAEQYGPFITRIEGVIPQTAKS